ncbi:MAG TPA: cellulase family glycosylhydrolase [Capsulimonadaceae bacterium]|jgi:hypothetical protein
MRSSLPAALAVALAATAGLAAADTPTVPQTFPFVIPWDDSSRGTATDMSFLNPKPAGVNGYIVSKGGQFVESKTGKPLRFFGTSITIANLFPEHADAEKVAAHLAKDGINIARLHFHDAYWEPLWDKTDKTHTRFDPVAIDKLDYLIAQLKKNGIYVDINLHVARKYNAADGFPNSVGALPGEFTKRIDLLNRRMIELQKSFARSYICRVNPYTGMNYADDPQVAMLEINNENAFASWVGEGTTYFDKLPEPFRGEVVASWNAYLNRKYGSTTKLVAVWGSSDSTVPSTPTELFGSARQWRLEDRAGDVKLTQTPANDAAAMADVEVANPAASKETWHKQLHIVGLDLAENGFYALTVRAKSDKERSVKVSTAVDQADWHNTGLDSTLKVGPEWRTFRLPFAAHAVVPSHTRITFLLGDFAGTLSLADVKLTRLGKPSAADLLGAGQTLEAGNIGLPSLITNTQRTDWRAFQADVETNYANEMRDFLRRDLKVHANIVATQVEYGELTGLAREAGSDFIDAHAYWQHPRFPSTDWDTLHWTIANSPMTDALASGAGTTFTDLALRRIAGKPYTITEYDHPAPSDYQAEALPEFASFASFQDWNGIFPYSFGNYGGSKPRDLIAGMFDHQANPAKEPFYPSAALMFRLGLIAPSTTVSTLRVPTSAAASLGSMQDLWRQSNSSKLPDLFAAAYQMAIDDKATAPVLATGTAKGATSPVSAVGAPGASRYVAVGDAAIALTGYLGGQTINAGPVSFTFPAFGNNFGALTLVATDGKPVAKSARLLLTIVGKAQNLEMGWNAERTSVGRSWGHGPSQAEGIAADVMLSNAAIRHVWALDPTGARVRELALTTKDGKASFAISPDYKTVWYELTR